MFAAPLVVMVATLGTASEATPDRWPIGSIHIHALSGYPDLLGASAILQAIPFIEAEAGFSALYPYLVNTFARVGPALTVVDDRDEKHRGLSWRVACLGGLREQENWDTGNSGLDLVAAVQRTYWWSGHFGVSSRLTAGIYLLQDGRGGISAVWPNFRLSAGFSF